MVGGSVCAAVVFPGVAVSGGGVCSVPGGSDCVAAGSVAEGLDVVVVLSVGVLLGVVGVVGAGSADGSAVTLLSGVWVLLCCEPVAGITRSFVIEFVLSLTAQLPHLGVRVICVFAAAFTVKVNASGTKICPV